MSTPRKGVVTVTCIETGSTATARAKMTMRFGGSAVATTRRATASCTMGARFAVVNAALKLLLGTDKTITVEQIAEEASHTHVLPNRSTWRVTR